MAVIFFITPGLVPEGYHGHHDHVYSKLNIHAQKNLRDRNARRSEADARRSYIILGFIASLALFSLLVACGSAALASYTMFLQPHDDKTPQLSIENLTTVMVENLRQNVRLYTCT